MRKNKRLSRTLSDRIFSGIIEWRKNLLELEHGIIVVEGKRDAQVLDQLGITSKKITIIQYSQMSQYQFEDIVNSGNYKEIIILTDFDPKGEEYLKEIRSSFNKINLDFRNDLYSITNGRVRQFEHLYSYLSKQLHESYWIKLHQIIDSV